MVTIQKIPALSFEHGLNSLHQDNFYSNDEDNPEHLLPQNETFNAESLIGAFYLISSTWQRQALLTSQCIPTMASITSQSCNLLGIKQLNVSCTAENIKSGVTFFSQSTLQAWWTSCRCLYRGFFPVPTSSWTGSLETTKTG